MERAIPMNNELTIPTPPATFAEAENSIVFCITSLFTALHEQDMSGLDRDILIDQYVRIMSTCLWHDVERWRVEELLDTYQKMSDANEGGDPIGALEFALELAAADRQILAYKTWAKK